MSPQEAKSQRIDDLLRAGINVKQTTEMSWSHDFKNCCSQGFRPHSVYSNSKTNSLTDLEGVVKTKTVLVSLKRHGSTLKIFPDEKVFTVDLTAVVWSVKIYL